MSINGLSLVDGVRGKLGIRKLRPIKEGRKRKITLLKFALCVPDLFVD